MSYICGIMTTAQHIMAFAAGREEGFLKSELSNALASFGVTSSSIDKTLQRLVRSGRLEVLERGKYRMRDGSKPHFMIQPAEGSKALYRQLKGEFPLLGISVWDVSAIMPLKDAACLCGERWLPGCCRCARIDDRAAGVPKSVQDELVHLAFGRDFIVIRPLISQSPLTETDGVCVPKIERIIESNCR